MYILYLFLLVLTSWLLRFLANKATLAKAFMEDSPKIAESWFLAYRQMPEERFMKIFKEWPAYLDGGEIFIHPACLRSGSLLDAAVTKKEVNILENERKRGKKGNWSFRRLIYVYIMRILLVILGIGLFLDVFFNFNAVLNAGLTMYMMFALVAILMIVSEYKHSKDVVTCFDNIEFSEEVRKRVFIWIVLHPLLTVLMMPAGIVDFFVWLFKSE